MAGYIGNIPTPQATQTRDHFTATANQTSFPTQGYTPGYLDVFLNGSHLDITDYTATDGINVVLDDGAELDDVLTIVSYSTFELADHYTKVASDARFLNLSGGTLTGDLGIGTTSPSEKLHVAGKARLNNGGDLYIDSTATDVNYASTGSRIQRWEVNGAERMRVDSSGNVGIGTTTTGTYRFNALRSDGNTAFFTDGATADLFIKCTGGVSTISPTTGTLAFGTSSTERMRVDSSGNMLVGGTSKTTMPTLDKGVYLQSQANDDVIGYSLYANEGTNNRRGSFFLDDANGVIGVDVSASSGVPDFVFRRASVEKMRVGGTNTTFTTDMKLSKTGSNAGIRIITDADREGYLIFGDAADNSMGGISYDNSTNSLSIDANNAERIRIDSSGNVGIGEINPDTELHVQGVITAGSQSATSGSTILEANYSDHSNDNPNILGTHYSNSYWAIGFGVRPKEGAVGYDSSVDNSNWARGALEVGDNLIFKNASPQTTAVGSTVALTERMRISSSGIVTKPNQPAFMATTSSFPASTTTYNDVMNMGTAHLNVGNNFNLSTDRFTAPVTGVYMFHGNIEFQSADSGDWKGANFTINGTPLAHDFAGANNIAGTNTEYITLTVLLSANDWVSLTADSWSGTHTYRSSFGGHLIG